MWRAILYAKTGIVLGGLGLLLLVPAGWHPLVLFLAAEGAFIMGVRYGKVIP